MRPTALNVESDTLEVIFVMKTHLVSRLGLGLSAALLIGGCIQTEDVFIQERQDPATQLTAPLIYARLSHDDGGCEVASDEGASSEMVIIPVSPATCSDSVPHGGAVQVNVDVDWRDQPFGSIQVSDACGSAVDIPDRQPWYLTGTFQAPPVDTDCTLTFDALDVDGNVLSSATMAFNVRAPVPRPNVQASIVFEHQGNECRLAAGQEQATCEPMVRGSRATLHIEVDWDTAEPGTIELYDCGGDFDLLQETDEVIEAEWVSPLIPGGIVDGTCTVGVYALSADNYVYSFELRVPLL